MFRIGPWARRGRLSSGAMIAAAAVAAFGMIAVNSAPVRANNDATHLRLATAESDWPVAGQAWWLELIAANPQGSNDECYPDLVHFSYTDSSATISADYQFHNGFGCNQWNTIGGDLGEYWFSITPRQAGWQTLTVSDLTHPELIASASMAIWVNPGPAVSVGLTSLLASTPAGVATPVTVSLLDAYGNVASGSSAALQITVNDSGAKVDGQAVPVSPTIAAGDGGQHPMNVTFSATGSRTLTVVATISSGTVGASRTTTVIPSPSTYITVDCGVQNSAGYALQCFVAMVSTTPYTGTVHVTTSDPHADTPADFTLSSGPGNYRTIDPTIYEAGLQWIAVTDVAYPTITGLYTGAFTPPDQTDVQLDAPASATAGPVTVTVNALESHGYWAYDGQCSFSSNDTHAVLPATWTFHPADLGVHHATLVLPTPQSTSVTVSCWVIPLGTPAHWVTDTRSIQIVHPSTSSFTVSGFPASVAAGGTGSITVTAKNSYGDTDTSYRGKVQFTSSDPKAVMPADYTFTASDAGVHTFTGLALKTAGTRSITATDSVVSDITGFQGGIVVTPGSAVSLSVSTVTSWVAGVTHSVTVTAKDGYGNTATAYRGTVRITSSDPAAVKPADYAFAAADNGSHVLLVTLKTVGTRSITATDTTTSSITGATGRITVTPGSVKTFLVATSSSWVAGASHSVNVTAKDSCGNTVTGYTGTVRITSSDPTAVRPADYTFTSADKGVHRFIVTLKTAGSQSITATDTHAAKIAGSQSGIAVIPNAVKSLLVVTTTTWVAGATHSVNVTAKDAYGNTVTGYTGTVRLTSSDNAAVLPADYTFTSADNGVHRFIVRLATAGTQSITATDTATSTINGSQTGIIVS